MPRSIATVTLAGPLNRKLTAAAAAGFDGVELCQVDLDGCPLTAAQVRTLAGDLGLRIFLWQPLRDIESVTDRVFARNLGRAREAFATAVELGADTVIVCSNTSDGLIDDAGRAAGQLGQLADLADRYGLRVAFEALSWGTLTSTYQQAWDLVAAAARPNLGVCLDSFHILARGSDLAGILSIPAGRIMAVQLAGAPWMDLDLLHWSRHHRCFPGQGDLDVDAFTRAVLRTGWTGPLALEVFSDRLREQDPMPAAADGMRALDGLAARCGIIRLNWALVDSLVARAAWT